MLGYRRLVEERGNALGFPAKRTYDVRTKRLAPSGAQSPFPRSPDVIKKLSRQGNSSTLIIDKALMSLLDLTDDSEVKVTVEGRKLIIEPLSEDERKKRFEEVLQRTSKKNEELFRRLAQ